MVYREKTGSDSEASCMLCKTYKCESPYFILKLPCTLSMYFLQYPYCQTPDTIASNVTVFYDFLAVFPILLSFLLPIMLSFFAAASKIHASGSPRGGEFMFLKIAPSNFKSRLVDTQIRCMYYMKM